MIPEIDISPLFGSAPSDRAAVDQAILKAAYETGFMTITGTPHPETVGRDACDSILRLFDMPKDQQRSLWKKNFAPENPNLYRGWFPLESDTPLSREGFELGPDLVRAL
nr:isopenicillin N synthase family oxygenase [Pseudomonadota bacterium]